MTSGLIHILDADVFIQASRLYYSFDIAPAFWDVLAKLAGNGQICSIDRVRSELERGNDELAEWAKSVFNIWFGSTIQDDVIGCYREVMSWVNNQNQFLDKAKSDFANGADGWLVAYAKAGRCVVVTQEQYKLGIKNKVPIPNVCQAFKVNCIDTFTMLRIMGVKLVGFEIA